MNTPVTLASWKAPAWTEFSELHPDRVVHLILPEDHAPILAQDELALDTRIEQHDVLDMDDNGEGQVVREPAHVSIGGIIRLSLDEARRLADQIHDVLEAHAQSAKTTKAKK